MSERTLVDYVLRGMKPYWRFPVKHADAYTPGIADLSGYVTGAGNVWIECKALDHWPKKNGAIVRLKRYTDEQRFFLLARRGFLLLRVGREYLLFGWQQAADSVGRRTIYGTKAAALMMWNGAIDWQQLLEVIVNENPNQTDL